MGIPYYFYNLTKKYKNIIVSRLPENPDIYAIDFNGIIHPLANKIINNDGNEDKIIEELWVKVNEYLARFKPKKMFICVDGIAPIAKIIQQRKRRYLTVFKNKIDNINMKWDTNAISPNTEFMSKLNKYFIEKISDNNNINYSGSNEVGEGEHKIFNKIKNEDENSVIIINGLDADLIILSLISGKKNIYLMRENNDDITYVSIDNLKEALLTELKKKWVINNESNDEIIDSYCCMCTILGNDFVPHLLTLNIKDNGLEKLINITGNSIKNHGLLVKNNEINHDCLLYIYENLAETEDKDIFKEIERVHNKRPNDMKIPSNEYAIKNKDALIAEIYTNPTRWRYLYYKHIFNINISIDTQVILLSCSNYIKGVYWTYNYYKKLDLDHTWYYPYNYPPTLKDISNYIKANKMEKIQNIGDFMNPNIQSLIILPPESINLLNDKYKLFMTDTNKGLKHMYPKTYKIQTFLKNHLWECMPVLPTINIKKIANLILK